MIQAVVDETYLSLDKIRQEISHLAQQLSADWFRLHDLLPLLETAAAQQEATRLTQATDPIFLACLKLQQAEGRAAALQQQLHEAQDWLQQAELSLVRWKSRPGETTAAPLHMMPSASD
ncbi:MAG TPA: hypothetical protein VKT82_29470 [Ktedonobacterales bacterium]|nr:hypothetical protein [Ktedonobacterales bacterium]